MAYPATGAAPGNGLGGGGLEIREERRGEAVVMTLQGELDLRSAPRLRVQLADAVRHSEGDVIVDMCDVGFIDSTGLAALLNALRRLTRARRHLMLVCVEGSVTRILRLTRLDTTFTLCSSVDEALALAA